MTVRPLSPVSAQSLSDGSMVTSGSSSGRSGSAASTVDRVVRAAPVLLGSAGQAATDPITALRPRAAVVGNVIRVTPNLVNEVGVRLRTDTNRYLGSVGEAREPPGWVFPMGRSGTAGGVGAPAIELWYDSGFWQTIEVPFGVDDCGSTSVEVSVKRVTRDGKEISPALASLIATRSRHQRHRLQFRPDRAGTYAITLVAQSTAASRHPAQGPGRDTQTILVQVHDGAPPLLETPVWRLENEEASRRAYPDQPWVMQTLPIPADSQVLRGYGVEVRGRHPFVAGMAPDAGSDSSTANNDSFDQAMAFRSAVALAQFYSSLDLPRSWSELFLAKGHEGGLKLLVNAHNQRNAAHRKGEHKIVFGTAQGRFDMGADGDVVAHELGHALLSRLASLHSGGVPGALGEGFADVVAALVHRDPEIAEDEAKVTDGASYLRNVENNERLGGWFSSEEVHDRGQIYGGFMWSLVAAVRQTLHEYEPGLRNEGLYERDAARIVFTFPPLLGTAMPTSTDVVVATLGAIEELARRDGLEMLQLADGEGCLCDLSARVIASAAERRLLPSTVMRRKSVKAALALLEAKDTSWLEAFVEAVGS